MVLNGVAQIEETALPLRLPVSLVCPRPNRFDQRVATQQLCKHGPTRNNR
jgi:hypothetical protein